MVTSLQENQFTGRYSKKPIRYGFENAPKITISPYYFEHSTPICGQTVTDVDLDCSCSGGSAYGIQTVNGLSRKKK